MQDAHSLYFETLGELGFVGLALIVGFLGWILVVGARCYSRAARERRTQIAAALAGCAAFCSVRPSTAVGASVASYRRARSLNTRSVLFER